MEKWDEIQSDMLVKLLKLKEVVGTHSGDADLKEAS